MDYWGAFLKTNEFKQHLNGKENQMKSVTVIQGQSIFDIAVQHCGSVDAAYPIARLNGLPLDATLLAGQALLVPELTDRRVVEELKRRGVSVGSAYSPAPAPVVPVNINYGLLYSWPVIKGNPGELVWAFQWLIYSNEGVNYNRYPIFSKPGSLYVDEIEYEYVGVESYNEITAGQWTWIADDEGYGVYVVGMSNEDFSALPDGLVSINRGLPRSIVSNNSVTLGWRVPDIFDFEELITNFNGSGGVPNYFNVRYAGRRDDLLGFNGAGDHSSPIEGITMTLWVSTLTMHMDARFFSADFTDTYGISLSIGYSDISLGASIRLCREATELEIGLTDGTACNPYTGTDGKVYRAVKIGSKVWTIDNLAETLMADGVGIPIVEHDSAWLYVKIAAACAYGNNYENVTTVPLERFDKNFGFLYNRMAAESAGLINDPNELGWRLPQEVYAPFGGLAGGDLSGLTYRQKLLLDLRPSSMRQWGFSPLYSGYACWVNFDAPGSDPWYFNTEIKDVMSGAVNYTVPSDGLSVRLVRPATPSEQELSDGAACAHYLGNDGKIYQTIKLGPRVYLARNLAETKYSNGTYIQGWSAGGYVPMTDETWQEQPAGALCCWENDETKI